MLTLYSPDNSKLMEVEALERRGNELLIKGKDYLVADGDIVHIRHSG